MKAIVAGLERWCSRMATIAVLLALACAAHRSAEPAAAKAVDEPETLAAPAPPPAVAEMPALPNNRDPSAPASEIETARSDQPAVPRCPSEARVVRTLTGDATYYGRAFAGRKTASGERFDPKAMTAAHKTLPFGTWVRVVRRDGTRQEVCVRITDRGPFGNRRRIIDVSEGAARKLEMLRAGVVPVRVEVLSAPD